MTLTERTIKQQLNLDALKESFLFANTPLYLYKHFRAEPTLQTMAKTYSTAEIVQGFYRMLSLMKEHIDNLVVVYALVIALTFKPYKDVREFFATLTMYREIEWAEALQRLHVSLSNVTQIYNIHGSHEYASPVQFGRRQQTLSKTTTSQTSINL